LSSGTTNFDTIAPRLYAVVMSRLPFELLLALRYLQPKRTFVSIITLVSILGVALGVAVLIIVISVMSGFDHDFRETILGFNPHLVIRQNDDLMSDYVQVAHTVGQNPAVKSASPFVMSPVVVQTSGANGRKALQDAPTIMGLDPMAEKASGELSGKLVAGKFDLGGRGVLVGADFAANMGLQVGDHLSIYSPAEIQKFINAAKRKEDMALLPDDYEVRGIFSVGYNEYDSRYVITSLENAQDLCNLDDAVHGLFVKLHDPYQCNRVEIQLQKTLGPKYDMFTWQDQNSAMLTSVAVEKNVMFFILFFIVLVAALCILSAQITFVIQKTREIGMLKAIGVGRLQISGIFVFQSAIIGVIGVCSGFTLGILAIHYRNEFLHFLRNVTGLEIFPASVYGFGELPALILPQDVTIICVVSFVICLLGGLLPAWRAGRLKPVEALRYE